MGLGMRVCIHICKMQILGGGLEMFGFAFNKKRGKHDSKIWLGGGGAKFVSSL